MTAAAAATEALVFAFRWSGVPQLVGSTLTRRRVAILVYHDPPPEVLDRHLRFLRRRHAIVPLDLVADALHARDWSRLPPRSVVVTLDDGHRGNFALLDVFGRHGVTPTIYLCTGIVGTRRHFWWTAEGIAAEPLKRRPNEERTALLERAGFAETAEHDDRQALTQAEVEAMVERVDFGAHTRFHPILTQCTEERAREEIERSTVEVAALTGQGCRHFSYPNGDHGPREVALVRGAGCVSARTIEMGWNGPKADPFRLRAIGVPDRASVNQLAARLGGILWLRERVRAASGHPLFRRRNLRPSPGESRSPLS